MSATVRLPLAIRVLSLSLPLVALAGSLGCGDTILASANSSAEQGDDASWSAAVSATGRFVAFQSRAANLVPDDHNSQLDVFVREIGTGRTTRVSIDSAGHEAHAESRIGPGGISATGRFVVFTSDADDLTTSHPNGLPDVFRHDRVTGVTELCSADPVSLPANGVSDGAAVSADGRFVAFHSDATNLVDGDRNGVSDVFVRDHEAGVVTRVSVTSSGGEADGPSVYPSISADGRFVAFGSLARLAPDDADDGREDVFVHHIATGETSCVTCDATAEEKGGSGLPFLSSDGRFVGFQSDARLSPDHLDPIDHAYVHDRATGETSCVSCVGGAAGEDSGRATVSADGRWVAFESASWSLVPGDTNSKRDAFLLDRSTGAIARVSVSSAGVEGDFDSRDPVVSADGRVVAFESGAENLVRSDTNQGFDVFVHYRDVANEGKQ
jgi:Tol biopolymer transport system component